MRRSGAWRSTTQSLPSHCRCRLLPATSLPTQWLFWRQCLCSLGSLLAGCTSLRSDRCVESRQLEIPVRTPAIGTHGMRRLTYSLLAFLRSRCGGSCSCRVLPVSRVLLVVRCIHRALAEPELSRHCSSGCRFRCCRHGFHRGLGCRSNDAVCARPVVKQQHSCFFRCAVRPTPFSLGLSAFLACCGCLTSLRVASHNHCVLQRPRPKSRKPTARAKPKRRLRPRLREPLAGLCSCPAECVVYLSGACRRVLDMGANCGRGFVGRCCVVHSFLLCSDWACAGWLRRKCSSWSTCEPRCPFASVFNRGCLSSRCCVCPARSRVCP